MQFHMRCVVMEKGRFSSWNKNLSSLSVSCSDVPIFACQLNLAASPVPLPFPSGVLCVEVARAIKSR